MSAIIIFLVIFVQKKFKDFYLWYNSASVYIPLNINKMRVNIVLIFVLTNIL